MGITTINISQNFAVQLLPTDENDLRTLINSYRPNNNSLNLPNDYRIIKSNLILKDLLAYTAIKSLPTAAMPDLQLTDSDTDKILKLIENENRSAKYQLELYLSSNNDDLVIGSLSILNTQGYRYRYYNLLDTINGISEYGEGYELKIKQVNTGYGYIKSSDIINIVGYYIQEIIVLTPETTSTIINSGGSAGTFDWGTISQGTQAQWLSL